MPSNFHTQQITLAAGAVSNKIDGVFNTIHLKGASAVGYTEDLSIKFDGGDFETFPTGSAMSFADLNDAGFLVPDIFRSVQIKNTGASSITFTITLLLGTAIDNNNVSIESDLVIQSAGTPSTRAPITASTSGITAAISANAKSVMIHCETAGLEILNTAGTQTICKIAAGDIIGFDVTDYTLTLKGIGASSTVHITELQ